MPPCSDKTRGMRVKLHARTVTPFDRLEPEELLDVGRIKRLLEMVNFGFDFREALCKDARAADGLLPPHLDAEDIRSLWDEGYFAKNGKDAPVSPVARRFKELYGELKTGEFAKLAECCTDQRFKQRRERQIARCASQFRQQISEIIGHCPVAFELSSGCSVGCWFCASAAQRLSGVFEYGKKNSKLWGQILELTFDLLGPAAGTGICYYGTEPFDNPDYERFCDDFHTILGQFPQTTIAAPLRDPECTRSVSQTRRSIDLMYKRCVLDETGEATNGDPDPSVRMETFANKIGLA